MQSGRGEGGGGTIVGHDMTLLSFYTFNTRTRGDILVLLAPVSSSSSLNHGSSSLLALLALPGPLRVHVALAQRLVLDLPDDLVDRLLFLLLLLLLADDGRELLVALAARRRVLLLGYPRQLDVDRYAVGELVGRGGRRRRLERWLLRRRAAVAAVAAAVVAGSGGTLVLAVAAAAALVRALGIGAGERRGRLGLLQGRGGDGGAAGLDLDGAVGEGRDGGLGLGRARVQAVRAEGAPEERGAGLG